MIELDRIYNVDCLEQMRRMDSGSVDCIITDPPYELENQGGGFYVTLRNQEDNVRYGHPTVKPLGIIRQMIVNSTIRGGNSRPVCRLRHCRRRLHQGEAALHRL